MQARVESGSRGSTPYYLGSERGWTWVPCDVLSYDEKVAKYEVRLEPPGRKKGEGPTKLVARLSLLFDQAPTNSPQIWFSDLPILQLHTNPVLAIPKGFQ